jgi:hypothetical protein
VAAEVDAAHRQLDELVTLGVTGRLVVHLAQGRVRRMDLEAMLMAEGEQQFVVVPTPRCDGG